MGAPRPRRKAITFPRRGEIYQFVVASDRHSLYQLRSELEWTISTQFRQVPGVADVISFGGYLPEVHVEVDPARLTAYDLTLDQVRTALAKSNQNVGGGFLRHGEQEMVVRGVGYIRSTSDLSVLNQWFDVAVIAPTLVDFRQTINL